MVSDSHVVSEALRDHASEQMNGNGSTVPPEEDANIVRMFETQVKETPDAPAVRFQDQDLTYHNLNCKANRLARYLREQGLARDQLAGICVERSLDMVVGLLGILKAGGAYIPLDPNYPPDRLEYMLTNAAPKLVLTQETVRTVLSDTEANVVSLDEPHLFEAYDDNNLSVSDEGPSARSLVYVIYTSGSTGRPKGIAMPHRSMANLVEWHRRSVCTDNQQNVLQFAPLSFDVSFQETFSTLCTGGTLILIGEWVRRDPRTLAEYLEEHSVHRLFVPPLVLQRLAECCNMTGNVPADLRDIIAAGEALRVSNEVVEFFGRLNGCRLHNHYGPSETHVVTALTLAGDPRLWPQEPPIGKPIANCRIHVLDDRLRPVPPGQMGEICIGGAAVARGYLGRDELTSQRFFNDPFSTDPEARLYRSGDLGRLRVDGDLDYLGRNDFQIKIRGFRVEPGEVEAALLSHSEVKQAVVIAREDDPGDKKLVAYITTDTSKPRGDGSDVPGKEPPDRNCSMATRLRESLSQSLPQHMVPAVVVELKALPMTPNGKVDRGALPIPNGNRQADQAFLAPNTSTERMLAGVWADVLKMKIDQIGTNDNFFKIGGDSLNGLTLITKIADALDTRRLSIVSLFENPTIRSMADFIDSFEHTGFGSPTINGPRHSVP